MNIHLERGRLLLSQNRATEAEKEFKQALATDPNNAIAMALLAECYIERSRYAEALDTAKRAVGLGPTNPFLQYTLARAFFYNKKTKEARAALKEGLAMNPYDADFFLLDAHIAFYEEDWNAALNSAEQGLEIDPENVNLINLRAQALIKLNRQEEAAQTMDYALNRAPENAYSHANKGWIAIEQDKYEEAIDYFKESLRLDPTSEFARAGLKEAIKAKNPLYRYILKYFLWMGKMQEKGRWGFIIGIYLLFRLFSYLAEHYPTLAPFLSPLIFAYIIFAFSSWIAMPVSNLFLRLHPLGKHSLSEDEVQGSNMVGFLGGAGILTLIAFYFTQWELLLFLGGFFLIMLIPIGGVYGVSAEGKARRYLWYYTIALAVVGLTSIFIPGAGGAMLIFFLGIFAYGWVANYLVSKDYKEFT